jgi:hypothetical protein
MKVNIYEHEMVEIMVTIGIICIKHSEKITGKRIKRTRLRIMYNNNKKCKKSILTMQVCYHKEDGD